MINFIDEIHFYTIFLTINDFKVLWFLSIYSVFSKKIWSVVDIVKEESGSYRFRVINKGGQIVFRSNTFPDEQKMRSVIKSFSGIMAKPGYVERRTDHQGRFLFCLKNMTGKVIGKSIPYDSEAGMENAIKNFRSLLFSQ